MGGCISEEGTVHAPLKNIMDYQMMLYLRPQFPPPPDPYELALYRGEAV